MAGEIEVSELHAVALRAAAAACGAVRAVADPGAYTGTVNAGGDRVLALDLAADRAIAAVLRAELGARGHATYSEESGLREAGAPYPLFVIDPVDGSAQARRRHPDCAVSIAVALGPTMGELAVGVVQPLLGGEPYHAVRGQGAYLGDRRLPLHPVQVGLPRSLLLEGTDPAAAAHLAGLLAAHDPACQLQLSGSIALQLALLAAGCYDALLACRQGARAYDIAAAWLIAREAGIAYTDLRGLETAGAPLATTEVLHQPGAARRADWLARLIGVANPDAP